MSQILRGSSNASLPPFSSELACVQCVLVQHRGHEFEELNELSQKKREEIKESVQTMPESVSKLEELVAKGMDTKKQIESSKKTVDSQILKAFAELREELNKRENTLLAKSAEISTAKDMSLTIQLEELTSLKDQILSCTACVTEVEESYNEIEFLSVVTTLQARVQELTQKFDKTPLKLRENGSVTLASNTETLQNIIETFGTITKHQPRDYKTLNKPVMTISSHSPFHISIDHNLDIFVTDLDGHHVHVYDKSGARKATYGTKGTGNGQFVNPSGISVVGDVMFVCEGTGSRVQKLTTGGECLSILGMKWSAIGQFSYANGCTVSSCGKIYIADLENSRVQVFNPDGSFSQVIGQGQLKRPRAIAIDSSGNIHVTSIVLQSIKVFTPSGELVREYGCDQLGCPSGIAIYRYRGVLSHWKL